MSPTRLSTVVLDAHDAHELAGFYLRLLGYQVRAEESDWLLIGTPPGTEGLALAFETEPEYTRPVRPTRKPGDQQMMLHLDRTTWRPRRRERWQRGRGWPTQTPQPSPSSQ